MICITPPVCCAGILRDITIKIPLQNAKRACRTPRKIPKYGNEGSVHAALQPNTTITVRFGYSRNDSPFDNAVHLRLRCV